MIKKKEDKKEEGITEEFLGGIPILGNFFKELGKTEVFKERFKEVDEKIKENLKNGEKRRWGFEANVSVRPIIKPIISEVKNETSEISLHEDYFYGKKGNKLTLAVKVPKEEVNWKIEGKNIFIQADNFERKIELPCYFIKVKKKQYKERILILELTK